MQHSCEQCSQVFQVTSDDLNFLDKLSPVIGGKKQGLPPPTHCPDCREQRRLATINQTNLYRRKCDLTGEMVVSSFHQNRPYKVYKQELWYSDAWDPMEYGREFDFNRSFFDQWQELSLVVPRPSLFTGYQYDENCDYTNHSGKNKNCYLIFDSDENRDCYYCYSLNASVNCMHCFRVRKSELCYQCVDSLNCYNCSFLQDCDNCTDSMFLKNCVSCKNCLMSSNLRNKEYYVENKKVSKEEFKKIRAMLVSTSALTQAKERFEKLKLEYPQKFMHGINNENVLGDYLTNSKEAYMCFDSADLWDCRYVYQAFNPLKDSMDIQECGDAEKMYESSCSGYNAQMVHFCTHGLGEISDMYYCSYCNHCQNLFGCIGLRHKQYCILNKQYRKEEYEALVPKIIEHMRKSKEWGEYYPISTSYYGYNETLAQPHYPLTKEQSIAKGYAWQDETEKQTKSPTADIPDTIAATPDEITNEVLACNTCKKNFRVIPQEVALYKQLGLPIAKQCFDCQLAATRTMRNPRKLFDRKCDNCKKDLQSTYDPKRPEKIYCEECYLKTVY